MSSEADSDPGTSPGQPTPVESTPEQAGNPWRGIRRAVLKEYGLWDTYKAVPPVADRDAPLETYLPGGVNYDE